ncbi:DNA translocase FtsK [Carboxydocella sporoproducens DSM 16521]|uniref:DNA translocase FtsK n=2 Tax=Carboxydocella TaxID=178898 RepID=A0A1T4SFD3_9FIRM|nr:MULTISPECIES: DNA translocase FtsK [Carboxydocella]AVX19447.1 DNA segregation ATPase FtsK/SpoIIIE [Carboxydocella thermautotrophica]SKA27014.1 DNA translocase FtsK [Carboxydocella sporoproducens DSM 16521]
MGEEPRFYREIPAPKGRDLIDYIKNLGQSASQPATEKARPVTPPANQDTGVSPGAGRRSPAQGLSVSKFEELFSYRRPVLLEELERKKQKEAEKRQGEILAAQATAMEMAPVVAETITESFQEDMSPTRLLTDDELLALTSAWEELEGWDAETADGEESEETVVQTELEEKPLQPLEISKEAGASWQEPQSVLPPLEFLTLPPTEQTANDDDEEILQNAALLEQTLSHFGIKAQVTDFSRGPTITRYELQPAPGVKVSRIVGLADDLALSLAAADIRIEAPIPGKSAVGIEVPNRQARPVYFRQVLEDPQVSKHPSPLAVALGQDIAGETVVADLARMPHLLIAGSTGSGKSVCMNTLIASVLFRAQPWQVKFLMIDPKMVELSVYNGIPHLLAPVVTDPKQATAALKWVVTEMENRYSLFAASGVRNLESYNQLLVSRQEQPLPLIVVLIDELADLMLVASKEVEEYICRLAQMARAAGIHLVIATQRPSVDVITGIIKANIPSRIAFAVSSQVDSRTILDMAGAEKLLGRGDMLFFPLGQPKPRRVQGAFVSDREIERLVNFWRQQGVPDYLVGFGSEDNNNEGKNLEEEDELLPEAIRLVIQYGQASASLLQRRFRIGYTRAARLIDIMEQMGVVGSYGGSKPREVLMTMEEFEQWLGNA